MRSYTHHGADFTAPLFAAPSLYPSPSEAALKLQFVGKTFQEIPTPAAIIDVAIVRRNCQLMLETAEHLGVGFRAHVKTHKVTLTVIRVKSRLLSRLTRIADDTNGEAPSRRAFEICEICMLNGV